MIARATRAVRSRPRGPGLRRRLVIGLCLLATSSVVAPGARAADVPLVRAAGGEPASSREVAPPTWTPTSLGIDVPPPPSEAPSEDAPRDGSGGVTRPAAPLEADPFFAAAGGGLGALAGTVGGALLVGAVVVAGVAVLAALPVLSVPAIALFAVVAAGIAGLVPAFAGVGAGIGSLILSGTGSLDDIAAVIVVTAAIYIAVAILMAVVALVVGLAVLFFAVVAGGGGGALSGCDSACTGCGNGCGSCSGSECGACVEGTFLAPYLGLKAIEGQTANPLVIYPTVASMVAAVVAGAIGAGVGGASGYWVASQTGLPVEIVASAGAAGGALAGIAVATTVTAAATAALVSVEPPDPIFVPRDDEEETDYSWSDDEYRR